MERKVQIVDAFIELVAEKGLEAVNLADVAAAAGVQQTAIRHFVGNRDDLIMAAIGELNRRYREFNYIEWSTLPDFATLVGILFNPPMNPGVNARAFAALKQEGMRHPTTCAGIRESYNIFTDVIAGILRREYPEASEVRIRDTAYAVECLSEVNVQLQRLGFPRARGHGAAKAALAIAEQLAES